MTSVERSKAMVLFLLIHCLLLPHRFDGDLCLVLVYCALLSVVPSFVIISLERESWLLYCNYLFNAI